MIKNSAIRVADILAKMRAESNQSVMNGWKQALGVETLVDVFIGIGKINLQLNMIEERFNEKNRDTTRIAQPIQEIQEFLNLTNMDHSISSFVNSNLKEANILAIGIAETIFDDTDGENIIEQAKLDEISTMVDDLIAEIDNLDIDKQTKKLFIKVLHEMKMSLKFYEIEGVSSIKEALINLICKTKIIENNPVAESFVAKTKQFSNYVGKIIISTVIGKGTESLYDSVIKYVIGQN